MTAIFLRTILMYAILLATIRVMGKRQLGELEPFELVVAVLISNLASQPLGDVGLPLVYGVVPVVTLTACQLLTAALSARSLRLRRLLSGEPSLLIEKGEIQEREMLKNGLAPDELFACLRRSGITDPKTVRAAILETDGTLSLILYEKDSPATPAGLGQQVAERGLPVTLVSEGRLLSENLRRLGVNERAFTKMLRQAGAKTPAELYVLTVDEAGELYWLRRNR